MKLIKKFNLLTFVTLLFAVSFQASAFDWEDLLRPGPSPGYGRGGETCTARDRGHEEHWGGHGSCRSCLREHGDCNYTCSVDSFQAEATGQRRDGSSDRFVAYSDYSDFDARDRALERCYDARLDNCYISNSDVRRVVTERGRCY